MTAPTHLLTVWNPSYVDDAMDAHLRVLLRWAERRDRGEAAPDDVYVWWAKLRSPRREGDLPHVDDVLALNEQITADVETHLYLTDYRIMPTSERSARRCPRRRAGITGRVATGGLPP